MTATTVAVPVEPSLLPDEESVAEARRIAERVLALTAPDPALLGSALARVATREGQDVEELALRLGCSLHQLCRLALCRRPDPARPRFCREFARIVDRTGVVPSQLALILVDELEEPLP